jgi:hypothetical protein
MPVHSGVFATMRQRRLNTLFFMSLGLQSPAGHGLTHINVIGSALE